MYDARNRHGDDAMDLVGIDVRVPIDTSIYPTPTMAVRIGGLVFRVHEGRRQWLTRTTELFVEREWFWTDERANAFPFAGYGCAEAVAEILRRNGEGDCFAIVCRENV